MSDAAEASPAKKTKAATKAKKPKTTPSHPPISDMVNEAISVLKERGGSSVHAIKKYIQANFKVNVEKLSPFIKKYLKTAVANGGLVQTKGKGATGSFRIGGSGSAAGPKKPKAAPAAKSPKKTAAVKVAKPKKPKAASPKKKAAAAKPKKAAAPKKPKSTPVKKAKPAAAKKKPVAKKPKAVKLAAAKPKKAKATPKKAAAKKGKK